MTTFVFLSGTGSVLNTESLHDLQQAADVLEYTLNLTSGTDPKNMVPIAVRHKLIRSQVLCKALLSQSLPKNYGHDNESADSQGPMSRALFTLEALALKNEHMADFTPCPTLKDVSFRRDIFIVFVNILF